jgi:ATP-dependent Lhr-like helicase
MKGCPYFLEASLKVEDNLRSGVVATSSLDLGVDFSSVDAVIQITRDRTAAPTRWSVEPSARRNRTHLVYRRISLELAEIAAARRALADGAIEPRPPLRAEPTC